MYRPMGQLQIKQPNLTTGSPLPRPPRGGSVTLQPVKLSTEPSRDLYASAAQACLNADQLLALAACVSGSPPPGISPTTFKTTCDAARQSGMFDYPVCPNAELPPIPSCLNTEALDNITYCERYPNNDGPDQAKNSICWAAHKVPNWYSAMRALQPCPSASPPPEQPPEPAQTTEPNYLLWGGLALLVAGVVGGTVYYATKK